MPEAALAASAKRYRPKLATILAEGYGLTDLRHDAMAGLTVAIVALPLSMAIAMASGVSPDRGLYTAIVGGFLVSALGGSRFQIGGPAGAFIVLVAATVAQFGIDGLVLAILLSGAMLTLLGLFRLGEFIRHIPHAVTVGFTAGIAVTILASQLKDLFGLRLAGRRARRGSSQTCGPGARGAHRQPAGLRPGPGRHRHHRRDPQGPAAVALHAGGGGRGLRRRRVRPPAGRDHRQPVWRHPARPARAASAGRHPGQGAGDPAHGAGLHPAGRDRVPAFGGGRRRHDGGGGTAPTWS